MEMETAKLFIHLECHIPGPLTAHFGTTGCNEMNALQNQKLASSKGYALSDLGRGASSRPGDGASGPLDVSDWISTADSITHLPMEISDGDTAIPPAGDEWPAPSAPIGDRRRERAATDTILQSHLDRTEFGRM